MINLTTDVPCRLVLREIVVGDSQFFDTTQSHVEDATEPLGIRPGQSYDYDSPVTAAANQTPDENFGVYSLEAVADAAGKTSHAVTTDPAVTRVVYEKPNSSTRGSTAPTSLAAGETVYVWLSDGTRFPCQLSNCSTK